MGKVKIDQESSKNLDLSIDEHQLEREWVEQPSFYFRYASKAAAARRDLDDAKNEQEVVKAELDQSIRDDPSKFGLSKVTEASIVAVIPTEPKYQAAQKAVTRAKYQVAIYDAVVTALDHRKKALEKLVDLHLSNYYSSPRASDRAKDNMEGVVKYSVRRKGRQARGS